MSARLHQAYAAIVGREMPWGLMVVLADGTEALVDRTKAAERSLARGSILDVDSITAVPPS